MDETYCIIPALLNMISTPPQESSSMTMASTSASLETSHLNISTRDFKLGRMVWTLMRAKLRAGAEMSAMRTEASSRANRIVVSRPIPLWDE